MVHPKVLRQLWRFPPGKQLQLGLNGPFQIFLKIAQKQFIIPTPQQPQDVIVIVADVGKQMLKHRIRRLTAKQCRGSLRPEQMIKQLLTQRLQQKILGLKMGIEGGAAHIRPLQNLPDRDLGIAVLRQQGDKRVKNSVPCLFLPSVHICLHTNPQKCSVTYIPAQVSVGNALAPVYTAIERNVRYRI